MKITTIGDIHGSPLWEKIIDKALETGMTDKVVFVGDYFDSNQGISAADQISNFKEIIAYRKANPAQVVLLFGNHDYHYISSGHLHYSGYQPVQAFDICEVLTEALEEDLIQMCYLNDGYLFSHAGVTKTWCENNEIFIKNIEPSINSRFKYKPNAFEITGRDKYGDDPANSPIWVRPRSLLEDRIPLLKQVVGHTQQATILFTKNVIFIDTLGLSGEYLVIDDGKPYATHLPVEG